MLIGTILCAGLLSMAQGPALPELSLNREGVLPPDAYLVRACAVTITTFRIDRVYVGPDDLKGKIFSGEIYDLNFNFSMPRKVVTPVEKGEVGIWWIRKEKGELVSVYDQLHEWRVWDTMVFPPALKDGSKSGDAKYDVAVVKAEVFEKVYHAAEKDRLKVIDHYVRSRDSIKGAAALTLLLRGNNPQKVPNSEGKPLREQWRVEKNPKIAEYALSLSKDESLSPRVQWEVDQLLSLNRDGWKDSPDEWKMWQRWFAGSWKEKKDVQGDLSDEKVLVDHFYSRPFTMPRRLELATAGLASDARTDRFKAELIRTLKATEKLARRYHPKELDEAFAELVNTIRQDAAQNRRIASSKLLVVLAPFSTEQRAALESLVKGKIDEAVKNEIKKVLAEK